MTPFTPEQIAALAPDDASTKAAKGLVSTSKWVLLAKDEHALWGHCQGSGKNPYQTAIDFSEPAFKCSCPSRKFPCKHGLALLYMFTQHTDLFTDQSAPDWVQEWLDKRGKTAAAKIAKAEATAADPVAQQKRHDARLKKATDGLADLRLWLDDMMRNGLISLHGNDLYDRSRDMAKRMIDAQMPTLAGALSQLAQTPSDRQDWLLNQLSKISLLEQSFQHRDQLTPEWQAEILTRLGFPVAKETVLSQPAHMDIWHHIGTTHQELERGEAHYHWLYGSATGKFAYIIDFEMRGAPTPVPSVLHNATYAGELCYYTGVHPQRALTKTWELLDDIPPFAPSSQTIDQAWQHAHQIHADNPFIYQQAMRLDQIHLLRDGNQYALSDHQHILPINLNDKQLLKLLNHTQGKPFTAFVLWHFEQQHTTLLSVSNTAGQITLLTH